MTVTLSDILSDCRLILPEIILVFTLLVVILADVMLPRRKSPLTGFIVLAGLVLALMVVIDPFDAFGGYGRYAVFASADAAVTGPQYAFSRMIVVDKLADFMKVVFFLGTIGVVVFTMRSSEIKPYRYGEYYTLLLSAVLGASFLVSANNFLMLVLALETLSLSSYVLTGYLKHNRLSAEASLKYILYGSVASGVMLFGISYIYGMSGTLDIGKTFLGIAMQEDNSLAIFIAFVLVVGGVAFKMAAVPFHFWCPDVYQGAPTPITAFLAVVSQAAGFGVIFRVFLPLFAIDGAVIPDSVLAIRGSLVAVIDTAHLRILFWVLAVMTMTLGNLVAIRQTDIKRLLAYSSIAHSGYILMGFTVFNHDALEAMLFYFFVYLFMNMGAFFIVIVMIEKTGTSDIKAYRGLGYRNWFFAAVMFLFLISLTGLPPTAGFLAKLKIFQVVIGAGLSAGPGLTPQALFYFSLAIIAGINTVFSLYYYMKITKLMYFDQPAEGEKPLSIGVFDNVHLSVYGVPVLGMILIFGYAYSVVKLF